MLSKSSIALWIISLACVLGQPATASNCQTDVKSCTPKQLCEAATSSSEGNKIWSSAPSSAGHVKTAKSIGIDCGVVQVVSSCETDPEMCTFTEICEKAVDRSLKMWKLGTLASKYVAIAREYGMSCGLAMADVLPSSEDQPQRTLARSRPKIRPQEQSITSARPRPKIRPQEQSITSTCKDKPTLCNDTVLCRYATYQDTKSGELRWQSGLKKRFSDVAKARQLSCGVTRSSGFFQVTPQKPIVQNVQNELNRIGCNVGQADGLIGPKTRTGLLSFTKNTKYSFDITLMQSSQFLEKLKTFPINTCDLRQTKPQTPKNSVTGLSQNQNERIRKLQVERDELAASMRATKQIIAQQQRIRQRSYQSCWSNCAMNNKAGKGVSNTISGMAECNSSCAPLKYGGAVVPPSWERNQRRLDNIDCTITQISKNQATARCNQF